MQHNSFLLFDFLLDDGDINSDDGRFVFLNKQGKLFLFHETVLVKQGTFKNKSMNFTLCHWLETDTKIRNLASKESSKVVIFAIYDVNEVLQTKIDSLRKALQEEAHTLNYAYPNAYHEDEYADGIDFSADYSTSINFPLEQDETIARINYVSELLADKTTIDLLTDKEIGFLSSACAVVRLTPGQKDFFLSIQGKINRIRAARVQ